MATKHDFLADFQKRK